MGFLPYVLLEITLGRAPPGTGARDVCASGCGNQGGGFLCMLLTVAHARLCACVVSLIRAASLTLRFRVCLNLLRGPRME